MECRMLPRISFVYMSTQINLLPGYFFTSLQQLIWNDEVRRLTGQPKLTAIVQSHRLALFGDIAHMDDNTGAKRILSTLPPEDWRRPRGCPRITWLSTIKQDLRSQNLTLPEAMDMAQNRCLWGIWSTTALHNLKLHAGNDDDGVFLVHV